MASILSNQYYDFSQLYQLNTVNKKLNYLRQIYKEFKKSQNKFLKPLVVFQISWALPSKKVLNEIKSFVDDDHVLEIYSGKGFWASLLKEMNVYVIATDNFQAFPFYVNTFTTVENLEAIESVSKYETNVLMMIWPPNDINSLSHQCLKNFKGYKFIYIGENSKGGYSNPLFFKELKENWKLVKCTSLINFPGLKDQCWFYVKKSIYDLKPEEITQDIAHTLVKIDEYLNN